MVLYDGITNYTNNTHSIFMNISSSSVTTVEEAFSAVSFFTSKKSAASLLDIAELGHSDAVMRLSVMPSGTKKLPQKVTKRPVLKGLIVDFKKPL